MRFAIHAVIIATCLFFAPGVQAAQAVAVEMPAGNYAHAGKYFPLLVTLQEYDNATVSEIRIQIGSLTFSRQVTISANTKRIIPLTVAAFSEHPDILVEVRSEGRRWRYPQLARALMDKLVILPAREHLVGILSSSPDCGLVRLFQDPGVTGVRVKPRLEFPAEVLEVFDLVAFEGSLWNTMDRSLREAVESYTRSGGKVFMSGQVHIPIHAPKPAGDGVLLSSPLGMGAIFVANPASHLHPQLSGSPAAKKRVLAALGLSGDREPHELNPSDAASAFEPLPRYLSLRSLWVVYLVVCALVLCGAALCGRLRLWPRTYAVAVMPVLAIGLSACFAIITPAGSVAYERITLYSTAARSDVALRHSYIQLYAFAASGPEHYKLAVEGLIFPARSGWGGCGSAPLTLTNSDNTGISGLCFEKSEAAVVAIRKPVTLGGGFYVRKQNGTLRFTNNCGFDMRDCVLMRSGSVTELGPVKFGQTVVLNPAGSGSFINSYLQRRFNRNSREERTRAAFAGLCMKKLLKPGHTYVVGWTQDDGAPEGYAQARALGAMWIILIEDGH